VRIGRDPTDSADIRLQKTSLVASALMMSTLGIVWGRFTCGTANGWLRLSLTFAVLSYASVAVFAITQRYRYFRFSQLCLSLLLPFFLLVALGGFVNSSAVILWSFTSPVGALVFARRRQAVNWFVAYLALVIVCGLIQAFMRAANNLPPQLVILFFVLNISGVSLVAFVLMHYFVGQKNQALRLLGIEQARSERLLLNVLPTEVAQVLKLEERVIAEHFEAASILFADMVGFTRLTAEMAPVEMVHLLNEIFTAFDGLVGKYGLEKIRTIGDNYMVASGVPRPRADHAQALAYLALEMRDYLDGLSAKSPGSLRQVSFRIGINSGPVVGGVIGREKFHYDVWGDAVNIASRMESQGEAGKIQITGDTYALIKDEFVCERRGTIEVKGRGAMETWYLIDKRH
jgi:guanylate cyclase